MKKLLSLALLAGLLGLTAPTGRAQIKSYTLPEMVAEADGAVFGEIVAKRVFRVDDPVDGPELYFTTITVQGRLLDDETTVSMDLSYNGGFLDPEHGVWNSEAPSAADTKIGNRVVAFFKWQDNIGGGVAANAIVAMHGGLYRTASGGSRPVVLGRGAGYAIDRNISIGNLERAIRRIRGTKKH